MTRKATLIIIAGATAVGKTAGAIEVAKELDAEIISADARQFYKEMNIGTAVPSNEELNTITHHFIQHKSIFDKYDVGQYEQDVLSFLNTYFEKKKIAVLCGGSGLYIRAVCNGLDSFPDVPDEVKNEVQQGYDEYGMEYLQTTLLQLDPLYFSKVDKENPHRLIRAIEVSKAAGKPFSSFQTAVPANRNFDVIKIQLQLPREELYDRINQRVDKMIDTGLVKEAKRLYPNKHLQALQTVGYTELFDYFDNKTSLNEAINLIKQHTRNYAKRQITWFKREPDMVIMNANNISGVLSFLKEKLV